MANAIKKAARSRRSHRDDKNFRQFAWNAHRRAEERAKIQFGRMLAEEMKKQREEKNAKED
jgi:basic membrane lipoprotein Med (substrate-binding protein (PBP1-ABC) superfamily)